MRARTFSDVLPGQPFWYENSNGLAEIAVNQGNAAATLSLAVGAKIAIVANCLGRGERRDTLVACAEFLWQRHGGGDAAAGLAMPVVAAGPASESVPAALKRLKRVYAMLDMAVGCMASSGGGAIVTAHAAG